MTSFLQSIGYNSWVLPALLIIPVVGAAILVALSPRDAEGARLESANRTARLIALWFCIIEFVVSAGLWWSFDPGSVRVAGGSGHPLDSFMGHPVHARARRHRADDDSADDVHHAADCPRELDQRQGEGSRVLCADARADERDARSVPRARSLPVLRDVGSDAHSRCTSSSESGAASGAFTRASSSSSTRCCRRC